VQHLLLRPELELLLYCANTHINVNDLTHINNLLQKEIDWNYLLQQAAHHGVCLILCKNLFQYYPEQIPKNFIFHVKSYCQTKTINNLFIGKKLCKLIKVFQENSINVIPFKGSVLSASLYQNLTLREFRDIDLIIQQEDFEKVKDLLTSQDYQPRSELQPWGQDFTSKDDRIHIDIHWQLAPSCFPYRVDFQNLWSRCDTIAIFDNDQLLPNLSPEDTLLVLCLEIVKDSHFRQEKLKQICDIVALSCNSSICWETVENHAKNMGGERLLWFGLSITKLLFQIKFPLKIQKEINQDMIVRLYVNHIIKQLFYTDNKQKKLFSIFDRGLIAGLYGFFLRGLMLLEPSNVLSRNNRKLVLHLLSHTFSPNSKDLEFIALPKSFYFLYYLIRPFRLSLKFCRPSNRYNIETL
jgi:Uncharacterised nucleotidyltransferase